MAQWKTLLDEAIEEYGRRDYLASEYRFAAPATSDEIARLENSFGSGLHPDLRSMLFEFNGVAYRDKYWGPGWNPLYLSVPQILEQPEELREYFGGSEGPIPAVEEFHNVAFFAQKNGFGVVYALCLRSFGDFTSGQVLALDHETGEFEFERESLAEFVADPANCTV